ncbi:MAG: thioredoxin [Cyclobacteriaceae bacterium]|nr:thioredoxin [Cyclobacteriaceae bacterium]
MAYELKDFKKQVIDRSFEVPVVVDFWAPWCGPCKVLGPVIEKLASGARGKWDLVKINVDEQQQISSQFGIRGIPAVKMVKDGKVIDEFSGALPEAQIKQWLQLHLPEDSGDVLESIRQLIVDGKTDEAARQLIAMLQKDANQPEVAYELAKIMAFKSTEEAEELLVIVLKEPALLLQAESLQSLMKFLKLAESQESLQESPVKPLFSAGLDALAKMNFDLALEKFIEVIGIQKEYMEGAARETCVAIFHYLGEQHELSRKYRRRFSMALY